MKYEIPNDHLELFDDYYKDIDTICSKLAAEHEDRPGGKTLQVVAGGKSGTTT